MKIQIGNKNFENKDEFCQWFLKEFGKNKSLDMDDFWEALVLYSKTREQKINHHIFKDKNGKLILQQGTLIHGVRKLDQGTLEGISKDGILAAELIGKNGGPTYLKACAFEVQIEQKMADYYANYNTPQKEGSEANLRPLYINGKQVFFLNEAITLPREEKGGFPFAFIVPPNNDDTSILSKKHDLARYVKTFSRASVVPIGIPSNSISGILVSREVSQDQEKLTIIKKYFPDKYITTPDGELIYEPQRTEIKEENSTSIADAMGDYKIEPNDEFGQELNEYFRNNPDIDVDALSEYINGIVDRVYKEFEDTTRTEDVNTRIERFNKRICTIRRNATFQRISMSNDKGKELYGKIAGLTETDIEQPRATDAKHGQEHQNETYLKRRDLEIRLKGLGYRMSTYDSNVSLEQALIAEKLLQQISIIHPSFLKLELGEMSSEELAFAQHELTRLGFNSNVPSQYKGTAFAQRIPLVMRTRSRDEITMCSQGIGLEKQEINSVTQETRGIIAQESTKNNDRIS